MSIENLENQSYQMPLQSSQEAPLAYASNFLEAIQIENEETWECSSCFRQNSGTMECLCGFIPSGTKCLPYTPSSRFFNLGHFIFKEIDFSLFPIQIRFCIKKSSNFVPSNQTQKFYLHHSSMIDFKSAHSNYEYIPLNTIIQTTYSNQGEKIDKIIANPPFLSLSKETPGCFWIVAEKEGSNLLGVSDPVSWSDIINKRDDPSSLFQQSLGVSFHIKVKPTKILVKYKVNREIKLINPAIGLYNNKGILIALENISESQGDIAFLYPNSIIYPNSIRMDKKEKTLFHFRFFNSDEAMYGCSESFPLGVISSNSKVYGNIKRKELRKKIKFLAEKTNNWEKTIKYYLTADFSNALQNGQIIFKSNLDKKIQQRACILFENLDCPYISESFREKKNFFDEFILPDAKLTTPGNYSFSLLLNDKIIAQTQPFYLPLSINSSEKILSLPIENHHLDSSKDLKDLNSINSINSPNSINSQNLAYKKTIEDFENILEWNQNRVYEYLESLSLSRDYADIISENEIDGSKFLTLTTKEDWKKMGITAVGDLIKLTKRISLILQKL